MSRTTKALWLMRLIAGGAAFLFLLNFADMRNLLSGMLFWIVIIAVRHQGHLEERRDHEEMAK